MTSHYREFAPGAVLEQLVECFWTHEAPHASKPVLPDGCIDLVFSRTTGLQLAGTMTRPMPAPAGCERFWGVRFQPGMARQFIGNSAVEFTDRVLPLEEVWGKRARTLQARMEDASRPEEMLGVLRHALVPRNTVSLVQRAISSLAMSTAATALSEVSRAAGLSQRQFRRRCLEETGIAPKQLARIARFRRTCLSVRLHPHPHWASLALNCGYYDQAHLIHDFQEFSGCTPSEYLRQRTG